MHSSARHSYGPTMSNSSWDILLAIPKSCWNILLPQFHLRAFYTILTSILPSEKLLEIGTSIGYSTLCRAHAVGPSGHVTTLKYSPEYTSLAKKEFEKNGVKNVQVIVGDAERLVCLALSHATTSTSSFSDQQKPLPRRLLCCSVDSCHIRNLLPSIIPRVLERLKITSSQSPTFTKDIEIN